MARLRKGACTMACLALLLLLPACPSEPEPTSDQRETRFGTTKAVVEWPVGSFQGKDHLGRDFGNGTVSGKTWIATFFFIQCTGPCPDMVRALKQIHDDTKDLEDARYVAFTFDPENDTVEALAEYARHWKVDPDRFHFVRLPTKKAVQELQESFKAASAQDYHHTPNFFLVDRNGNTRRWWDARQDDERASLTHDLRRLIAGKELGP